MKKFLLLLLVISICVSIAACGHAHVWIDATCTEANTCLDCGETEGEPLGHAWEEATCTEPKTCSVCGETDGKALGHAIDVWERLQESTCSTAGTEIGNCPVCGDKIEREVALAAHIPGDWIVLTTPSESAEGKREKRCTICDAVVETGTYSLSAEELESLYKEQCSNISYDSLARTPDQYEGQKVKFTGKVLQVCSEASSALYYSTYRVATSGGYDNVVYLRVDNYGSGERILEDDWITFYGEYDGLYSYTTVMGAERTIPSVNAKYVD